MSLSPLAPGKPERTEEGQHFQIIKIPFENNHGSILRHALPIEYVEALKVSCRIVQ